MPTAAAAAALAAAAAAAAAEAAGGTACGLCRLSSLLLLPPALEQRLRSRLMREGCADTELLEWGLGGASRAELSRGQDMGGRSDGRWSSWCTVSGDGGSFSECESGRVGFREVVGVEERPGSKADITARSRGLQGLPEELGVVGCTSWNVIIYQLQMLYGAQDVRLLIEVGTHGGSLPSRLTPLSTLPQALAHHLGLEAEIFCSCAFWLRGL